MRHHKTKKYGSNLKLKYTTKKISAGFTKKIENFTCAHCKFKVIGSGYTNHCSQCLWSRHVDVNPGDRLNACGGMMKPVAIELDHGDKILIHQCEKCGLKKRNKVSPTDDINALLSLNESLAKNTDF